MVVVTPDRELVVNLTLDSTALVAELDRVVAVLAAAADQLRPASPVPSPPMTFEEMPESERELLSGEPVDRTGLCDHCDKPQTGGAAGGGISPEHWCDDHRPAEFGGMSPEPEPTVAVCFCGKPFTHLAADPDSDDWACRAPEVDAPQPASVGPVSLEADALDVGCACGTCADQRARVVDLVQRRLGQYEFGTPMSQVYSDWFGGGAS